MFAPMDPILLFLASLFTQLFSLVAQPTEPTSQINVVGVVYCDICSTNTFSRYSYFLPGVDVHIQCKFKANSPKTREQIAFSVNRTTDKYGVYNLEIPSVDGIDCVEGREIESFCQASLIGSSSSACNVPGLKTTSNQISVKSKQDNLCIYSLDALSYRPSTRNITLCRNHSEEFPSSLNSSKFFLPYCPPYGFPWPPLPQLPPLPPLPPFPSLPFPPLPPFPSLPSPPLPFPKPPSLPFPFPPLPPFPPTPSLFIPPPPPPTFNLGDPRTWIPNIPSFTPPPPPPPPLPFPKPPSLPFPFPPFPPFPPTPSLFIPPPPPPTFNLGDPRTWIPNIPSFTPPPPAFNLGDPRTWIPNIPSFTTPPPPAFNLRDPRTWIPNIPSLTPPPPPAFNLRDPRTWIPYIPPTPPNNPQNQQP